MKLKTDEVGHLVLITDWSTSTSTMEQTLN